MRLDVTRPAHAEAAVQAAVKRFGRIDVLVNNAANFYGGYFEELTPTQTNKYEANSKALIEALGLTKHFAAIAGQDTFTFRKPDPRHLTETIRLAGGDPHHALMVGDLQTDIDTAKAAGIPVVAVDFGYTDRHVREFEPSAVISHFDALTLDLAERLIAAAAG